MKIICKKTTFTELDLKEVTTVLTTQVDYGTNGRGLIIGKEHLVMGMTIYKDSNCLHYLIDINGWPLWFPYLLFDVSDNFLPDDWFIKIIPKTEMSFVYILCGFYELCNEENFYSRLVDVEPEAVRTYFKRKAEMRQKLGIYDLTNERRT